MVAQVLAPLGGISALIKPKSTVVVKPNGGHPGGPETSVNTSPEVVSAVIKEIRKADPKEIIVAESAAIGCDTMACLEISGILKAAREAGVPGDKRDTQSGPGGRCGQDNRHQK
jgi:uncharacterized protein (DUF362 family)